MIQLRAWISLGVLASTLSACSTVSGPDVFSKDRNVGYYKLGKPYQIDGQWYAPKVEEGYKEEGMASWYGPGFHGKKTANGDVFDENALTAAHRTLPMPSMVRVTNVENGRTLVVMVNDRGPFSKGRILDLSKRSAEILGVKEKGVARVQVQYLPGQTRKLLAQMEQTKGMKNPFATADANFGQRHANEESITLVNNEYEGVSVPENFSIAGFGEPGASQEQTSSYDNSYNQRDDNAPIGLMSKSSEESFSFVSSAHANEALPSSLSQNSAETRIQPLSIEEEQVVTRALDASADKMDVYPVPDGKVLIDKDSPNYVSEVYFVQAGSFKLVENADRAKNSLSILGEHTQLEPIQSETGGMYRVRLGPVHDPVKARQLLQKVTQMGYADALMTTE
jgi:rare lipoprotein A